MDKQNIPVFFAVDDGYMPFLAVVIQSLIDNSSKDYIYDLKILYTKISDENQSRIKNKYESDNVKIEFVDLNNYLEKFFDKFYTRDYYSKTTYYRLFIPDLYPEFDKAIYLDSDMAVLTDVANLYNIDLGNNLVGASTDGAVQAIPPFQEYVEKVVGMADSKSYFNAGMLLMNLDELRKFKFQEKFLYLLETVKFAVAQDQDYLNRICKGRTLILPGSWNTMPGGLVEESKDNLNIIHYNLSYKPWHFDNIMYQDYFWYYAKKTDYYDEILKIKNEYTDEQRNNDLLAGERLIELAIKEAECVGDDRISKKQEIADDIEKSKDRLEILKKIEELEKQGKFDSDAEEDPPTRPLMAKSIDYLRKGSYKKLKTALANRVGKGYLNSLLRNDKLLIKEIKGLEYLDKVTTGAVVTCNHFNPYDCFAIESTYRKSENAKSKKLYKVIREGNYTNFPGLYGFFFRNCDTLPLSSSNRTMIKFLKAVDTILQKGDFILMYPEQSLWWNYKKPKPLKNGAFKLAARNHVPIIPIFITMEDSDIIGNDGFPVQQYTINISEPIYPEDTLSEGLNAKALKEKNFQIWKNIYEEFYKIPLEYTTENAIVEVINENK
ncbi:MAG: 1-acyl-sn-glycerol-3-phosphate acyltransferase [Clostridia bacterium]|nr:1-acyl-sn-glycerol-3-phosphate acyltransferase [Clostridia bacterium]